MDFSLSNEQRAWQMTARKFADEEIRPISLERDADRDGGETWDWDIIEKGSKLGFRTLAVPKEWGGQGTDFVTQALVMAELARGDSAMSKAFSQNWKWSHLISAACTEEQKERFLRPLLADDRFVLGKGITEPNAGSDNRLPPDDPKAGLKLTRRAQGRRMDPQRREVLHRQRAGRQAVLHRRAHRPDGAAQAGHHHVPGAARHARLPHRQGVQQERLALLPERRDDLRERARAARQCRRRGQRRDPQDGRRRAATPPAATCSATSSSPPTRSASATTPARARCSHARTAKQGGQLAVRAAERPAADQQDVHADRGAALVRDAGRLGARHEGPLRQRRAWR